jgi:hypothetical protein
LSNISQHQRWCQHQEVDSIFKITFGSNLLQICQFFQTF